MRISSPKLSTALMKGITEQEANAILIGRVCTDAVYFASGFLDKPAVMFTASHNPMQYNGLKLCRESAIPINQDTGLQKIKSIMEKSQYEKTKIKNGRVIKTAADSKKTFSYQIPKHELFPNKLYRIPHAKNFPITTMLTNFGALSSRLTFSANSNSFFRANFLPSKIFAVILILQLLP